MRFQHFLQIAGNKFKLAAGGRELAAPMFLVSLRGRVMHALLSEVFPTIDLISGNRLGTMEPARSGSDLGCD